MTRVLLAVSKLLAQPASHDLIELCELRNMLLSGGRSVHHMKFIDSKALLTAINVHAEVIQGSLTIHTIWDHLSHDGFFGQFGRPATILIGSRTVVFWPDDWVKVIGGLRALGHFVEWFDENHGYEISGQVVGYIRRTDEYLVQQICPADGQLQLLQKRSPPSSMDKDKDKESSSSSSSSSLLNAAPYTALHLKTIKHNWVDPKFRHLLAHRLTDTLQQLEVGGPAGRGRVGDPSLEYSDLLDKGRFVRVWWSRYKKFFYGRVVRYDSTSQTHLICYEDGDHRSYEMFTRDYEIVLIPRSSDIERSLADEKQQLSDHEAAKLVAEWHLQAVAAGTDDTRQGAVVLPSAESNMSASVKDSSSATSAAIDSVFTVERPSATCATALCISQTQIAVVNEYLLSGGPDSLFQSLTQTDSSSNSCSCRLLQLHLYFLQILKLVLCSSSEDPVSAHTPSSKAVVQMDMDKDMEPMTAMTGPQFFSELLWEFKESLPGALLRFEDAQMKEMDGMRDLNDLLSALQGMILVDSQHAETFVDKKRAKLLSEGFDLLRLDMVLKLLVCSQIQKRYSGLLVVKEVVFSIMPKLESYLTHRQKVLDITRANRQPVVGAAASRASSSSNRINLPAGSIDEWLVEKGIVELLFGESLHRDLIAKSDCVIAYMASRKLLTEAHLSIIWQASLGVHEAVVRVLHQLMLVVVPILDPSLRMHLFSLMSALPSWEFTEQILQLIAAYTVQSLIAFRDEAANQSSSSSMKISVVPPPEESSLSIAGTAAVPSAAVGASMLSRRGLVMSSSQRQWMGFGVLWQFVQDPNLSMATSSSSSSAVSVQGKPKDKEGGKQGVQESLVDVAVQLLVELLQEEFKEERELVMQRCLENMKYGISVPVSLQILRRTLALYPLSHKSWFVLGRPAANKASSLTAGHQIEKLIRNSQLLDILFRDLDSFHKNMVSMEQSLQQQQLTSSFGGGGGVGSSSLSSGRKASSFLEVTQAAQMINESRMQQNGKFSRVSHLKAVGERLDFLRFIISWSSVKLNEGQTGILWNAFAEETPTLETLEKFVLWLHGLLNKEHRLLIVVLQSLCMEGDLSFEGSGSSSTTNNNNHCFSSLATLLTSFNSTSLANKSADLDMEPGSSSRGADQSVSTFEEGVLVRLFEDRILKWVNDPERLQMLSRVSVASLCIKLFLLVNICSKAIRVEPEGGSWYCAGPLAGLALLWRLALDATDDHVSSACISLLVELHHRVSPPPKPAAAATRSTIVDNVKKVMFFTCFKHLYLSIQSLQAGEEQQLEGSQSGGGGSRPSASDVQAGEWFDDVGALLPARVIATRIKRLVVSLRSFVQRFYVAPIKLFSVKVLVGREESLAVSLRVSAADKLGYLRFKVAEHFKEPMDSILLYKASTNKTNSANSVSMLSLLSSASDQLDRDDLPLHQCLSADLSVVVKRRDGAADSQQVSPTNTGDHSQPQQHSGPSTSATVPMKDLFAAEDLSKSLLHPLQPLQWMYLTSARHASTSEPDDDAAADADFECSGEMFQLPPNYYLCSSIQTLLRKRGDEQSQKDVLSRLSESRTPYTDVCRAADEHYADVTDQLSSYFSTNAMFMDHLIEMLDGYLSAEGGGPERLPAADSTMDQSAAVFDLLQSLPLHASLQAQVEGFAAAAKTVPLPQLLSTSCPYRLLYTLQIVEQCLRKDGGLDWAVRFFHEGGADYVAQLLNELLLKESTRQQQQQQDADDADDTAVGSTWSALRGGLPRCDLSAMNIAMLSRTAHHLLSLDTAYYTWQSITPKFQSNKRSINECSSANLPIGIVMSCMDLCSLVTNILHATMNMARLLSTSGLTATALEVVCDNALLLLFNVLAASDDVTALLRTEELQSLLLRWVRGLCVECSATRVRETACRRLFEACANIFQKCANPLLRQEHKRVRLLLFDVLFEVVTAVAVDAAAGSASCLDRTGGELYSLLAALEALRSSPYLVFPQLSSSSSSQGSSKGGSLKSSATSRFVYAEGPDSPVPESSSEMVASPLSQHHHHHHMSEEESGDGLIISAAGDLSSSSTRLIAAFADKLAKHRSVESFHSLHSDSVLVGILRLLLVLANMDDRVGRRIELGHSLVATGDDGKDCCQLIPYLYKRCLFPSAGREAVCQTKKSRSTVFALLFLLCSSAVDNLQLLTDTMLDCPSGRCDVSTQLQARLSSSRSNHGIMPMPYPQWDYDPNAVMKETNASIGLSNQGATCYMNSFIQQLFHVSSFTEGLLRISSTDAAAAGSSSRENEAMLFQLQVMFGFMKLSQKRFYDTLPFCLAFRDYDGSPISLVEQKDINEFAGMLFEKLEHSPEGKRLLSETIQGTIVWKTTSIENGYRSEREEHFYMLTAEVKDKACLEDSLELYTAAELFSGDNKIEDSEGRKVDALRRCAIRTLPPTLIIHLKRFEFDLETLDRKKVNDRISFPMDLNMFRYTEEGLLSQEESLKMPSSLTAEGSHQGGLTEEDADITAQEEEQEEEEEQEPTPTIAIERKEKSSQYYQYTLKGVVAHVGAIDRGHYYSFIKESCSDTWLEFNDRKVVPFSQEAIPSECFGGKDEYVDRHGMPCSRVRENNAYLLVYERTAAVTESISGGSAIDRNHPSKSGSATEDDSAAAGRAMDRAVFDAISSENQEFQRDKFLFDATHFAFMWQLLNNSDNDFLSSCCNDAADIVRSPRSSSSSSSVSDEPCCTALTQLVLAELQFVVEVLVRARAHGCVSLFFDRLQHLIRGDASGRCAQAVLRELTVDQWHHSFVGAMMMLQTEDDLFGIEQLCHPWLMTMLVLCPFADAVKSFLQFLFHGVMMVTADKPQAFLLQSEVPRYPADLQRSIEPSLQHVPLRVLQQPVSRLVDSLLFVLHSGSFDCCNMSCFFYISMFLFQFAAKGSEERQLLIHINGVNR